MMKKRIAYAPLRPFIGGVVVAAAVYLLHADRYIGLGIPVIVDAFQHPLAPWDFLGKLVFTVTSLGSGFKGGEVTPLFYVGATLGNALAHCCICRLLSWQGWDLWRSLPARRIHQLPRR